MFLVQVPRTTISFTWRIIGTTSLLISTTNVVFLIFKWCRCFYLIIYFYIRYTIPFCPFNWVVWFLILYFPAIEVSGVSFILSLRGIRYLSDVTLDKTSPCTDLPEIPGLSFLISISFGFSILELLSNELDDEIDLDLFTDFTVSSVSVLWVDLDLYNDLPLSDLFLMNLSFLFYMLVVCLFCWLCKSSISQCKEQWLLSSH